MGPENLALMKWDWPEILILAMLVLLLASVAGIAAGLYGRRIRCDRQTAVVLEHLELFQPGDKVTCGGVNGTIDAIHRSGVRLTLSDSTIAFVPNAQLMAQVVINHSRAHRHHHTLAFHIDEEDNIESAMDIIDELLSKDPRVCADIPAEISVPVPREGTCCVRVAFWARVQDGHSVRQSVSEAIEKSLKLEDIHGWAIKDIIHPRVST